MLREHTAIDEDGCSGRFGQFATNIGDDAKANSAGDDGDPTGHRRQLSAIRHAISATGAA